MAKMLIQSETLTAIADKIRVLSGTEDAMSLGAMESHVGEANTDVATEANLIAQIASALEGKASSSGVVKTCTVTINFDLANVNPAKYPSDLICPVTYIDTSDKVSVATGIITERISISQKGHYTIECKCGSMLNINIHQIAPMSEHGIPKISYSDSFTNIDYEADYRMWTLITPKEPGNYTINVSFDAPTT